MWSRTPSATACAVCVGDAMKPRPRGVVVRDLAIRPLEAQYLDGTGLNASSDDMLFVEATVRLEQKSKTQFKIASRDVVSGFVRCLSNGALNIQARGRPLGKHREAMDGNATKRKHHLDTLHIELALLGSTFAVWRVVSRNLQWDSGVSQLVRVKL